MLVAMLAVSLVLFSFMLPPLQMADIVAAHIDPVEVIWYDDEEEDEVDWDDDVEWDDDTSGVTDEVEFVVWEVVDSDGDEWEVIWENVEKDEGSWETVWEEVRCDPNWEIVWVELN